MHSGKQSLVGSASDGERGLNQCYRLVRGDVVKLGIVDVVDTS